MKEFNIGDCVILPPLSNNIKGVIVDKQPTKVTAFKNPQSYVYTVKWSNINDWVDDIYNHFSDFRRDNKSNHYAFQLCLDIETIRDNKINEMLESDEF
jgi:hypothetical protein